MRKRRLLLNTGASVIHQIISIVCGFILPRLILSHYGSSVNGLVSSITQFLGFVTLMDMGVGAVVQSSLYKPLAEKDTYKISQIMAASNQFFSRIAIVLCIYSAILMAVYPFFIDDSIGVVGTSVLVFSISLSMIAQYFFGITNQLLLNADQKSYIQLLTTTGTTILNTLMGCLCIYMNTSIQTVKLISSFVLFLRPLIYSIYVKRNYSIDRRVSFSKDVLTQKWDALCQHIATFVVDKTDVVVLTFLSTLKNVSVYTVYQLVVACLYHCCQTLVTGIQSLFGDMIAKGEKQKLLVTFSQFEWIFHFFVSLIYGCSGVLLVSFVGIYTSGINDANYINPVFSWIMTISYFFCSLRCFYNIVIKAAGHYRQTQKGAIIEAVLNIFISIIAVWKFGLVGVAVGTMISMAYRVCYFNIYMRNHILNRDIMNFIKNLMIDVLVFVCIFFTTCHFSLNATTYFSWMLLSLKVFIFSFVEAFIINFIFYNKVILSILALLKGKKT